MYIRIRVKRAQRTGLEEGLYTKVSGNAITGFSSEGRERERYERQSSENRLF